MSSSGDPDDRPQQLRPGAKAELKRQRERQNLTLSTIAESTKIKASVLAALERNDFSHWPEGIFRRGYLRAYASAIGLPPELVVAEFVRLFPEAHQIAEPVSVEIPEATETAHQPAPGHSLALRLRAAAFDAAAIFLISGVLILTHLVNLNLWLAIGIVGLGYSAGGTIFLGRGIGMAVVAWADAWFSGQKHVQSQSAPPQSKPAVRELGLVMPRDERPTQRHHTPSVEANAPARRASA